MSSLSAIITCLETCFCRIYEIDLSVGCICLTILLGLIIICLPIVFFLYSKHTINMKAMDVEIKKNDMDILITTLKLTMNKDDGWDYTQKINELIKKIISKTGNNGCDEKDERSHERTESGK